MNRQVSWPIIVLCLTVVAAPGADSDSAKLKTLRSTPLLLARTIHWRPKPAAAHPGPQGAFPLLWMFAGAALFAVLATMYIYYRTRAAGPAPGESLLGKDRFEERGTSSNVGASMQQLAESDRAPDSY